MRKEIQGPEENFRSGQRRIADGWRFHIWQYMNPPGHHILTEEDKLNADLFRLDGESFRMGRRLQGFGRSDLARLLIDDEGAFKDRHPTLFTLLGQISRLEGEWMDELKKL